MAVTSIKGGVEISRLLLSIYCSTAYSSHPKLPFFPSLPWPSVSVICEFFKMTEWRKNAVKLSYFMDMSDREIGELLDMARRTVQHQRTDVLAERRKQILLSHEAEVKIHKRPWMICVLIQIGIVIDRIAGFLLIPIGGNRLQKMAHYQLVLIGLYRCLYKTIHSSFSCTFFLCLRFFYFFGRILVSPCSHVFSADCIFTKPT